MTTSSSPRKSRNPRRRFSSGSQDTTILASLTNRENRENQGQHALHAFPSAPALGKTGKPSKPSQLDSSPREQRLAHIYDRAYYTDGSDIDVEVDWRRELVRRGRSTSDVLVSGGTQNDFGFQARHRSPPTAYASLPATPTLSSKPYGENEASVPLSKPPVPIAPPTPMLQAAPPRRRHVKEESKNYEPVPFSLWDYLREELLATDFDSHQELKWERVSNFLNIPLAMEKVHLLFSAKDYFLPNFKS